MQHQRLGPGEMFCWSCGAAVSRRAALCTSCGVKLDGSAFAMTSPVVRAQSRVQPLAQPLFGLSGRDLPHPSALLAVLLAMAGAVFGIVGAFQAELPALLLAPFVWAPVIEEVLKPSGVYAMLIKWPGALKGRLHTAALCSLGGLAFGLVESAVYMTVYFPEHTPSELAFRFTVPVMLHMMASFVFGLGINRQVLSALNGRGGLRRSNWAYFLTAIVIHSAYNVAATVVGVLQTSA